MDLRDQFAMAAMQGLLASDFETENYDLEYHGDDGMRALTARAYRIADAMMAERQRNLDRVPESRE